VPVVANETGRRLKNLETSSSQYYEVLQKYLGNLPLDEVIIAEVLECFAEKYYRKNEYFSFVGQTDDKLGFVVNGLFYMFIESEEGTVFTKDFLRKEQFLLALFDPQQESLANIQAIKDSIVLEAKYSDIQTLFHKYHQFEALAKQGMERRLESIYARMESLALLEAKDRYRLFQQEYGDIEAEIPQYLIASYLGITPTQLSRIRKTMK